MGAAHFISRHSVCVHFIMFIKLNRFSHCVCVPEQLQNFLERILHFIMHALLWSACVLLFTFLPVCDVCMWSRCGTLFVCFFSRVNDKIENKNRYAATRIYKTVHSACYNQHWHRHTISFDWITFSMHSWLQCYKRFSGCVFRGSYQKVHISMVK